MSHTAILSVFIGLIFISNAEAAPQGTARTPILFIPGLTGSPLDVQESGNGSCNTNGETYNIWINISLISNSTDCFTSQMRLNYSVGYSDAQEVIITVPNFGNVSLLDLYSPGFLQYFLERGYTRDKDIRVAPYDWRLSPEELNLRGFYDNLRQLIQTIYEQNDNTKVTIVVHSMGGPVSLYFLTRQVSQEWKDTYIHSYITLSGAWSGGNAIMQNLLSGPAETEGFLEQIIGSLPLRSLYRSFPSSYLLFPRASVWNDTVLVVTPDRNYTANDYQQLFSDVGYPQGYTQYTEIDMDWPAPNVSTYCFYGLGVNTPMSFVYGPQSFPDMQPTTVYGDGDDAVNKPSSEVCLRWANSGYPFNRTVFQGVDHTAMTSDPAVLRAIGSIIGAPEDPISGSIPLSTLKPLHYVAMLLSVIISITFLS